MANTTVLTNNFSQGEVSEKLRARVETPAYQNGCRVLTNFIPMSTGGVRRRPGGYHAGYSKGTTNKARLVPFRTKYNTYVVELTALVARFWKTDHTLLGAPTELTTPWNVTEMVELHYGNLDNTLYLVHGIYAPRAIAEATSGTPTISAPTFTGTKTWGAANNYPRVCAPNAGRLALGATLAEPTLLAQSRAPNSAGYRPLDFTAGTYPDDAIFTYQSDEMAARLTWIFAKKRMAAGSEGTTWIAQGQLPTPGTFWMDGAEAVNSPAIQACAVGNAIVYVGGPAPSLHMLTYTEEGGGLVDIDLTEAHDHILKPGVVEIATMASPEKIVWIVRTDGKLVSCTLRRGGWGFAVHELGGGGLVESACVIRTATGDELWLSVNRSGNRCIEWLAIKEDDDQNELHYVDAGIRFYSATPTATVTGLTHLNGKVVIGVGDGGSLPEKTVSAGQVVYDRAVSIAHVGLKFTSTLRTNRPEVPLNQTWQGKKKRAERLQIPVYKSYGGKVGQELAGLQPVPMVLLDVTGFDAPPLLRTEDLDMNVSGVVDTEGSLYIVADEAWPYTVLATIIRFALMET